mmetsp:Transcript_147830/g.411695  ORF Transcript_147830/g.411695 Transcript_147830/m.411695 type:complete len:255 (+) Transcript_147830:49-813(+)
MAPLPGKPNFKIARDYLAKLAVSSLQAYGPQIGLHGCPPLGLANDLALAPLSEHRVGPLVMADGHGSLVAAAPSDYEHDRRHARADEADSRRDNAEDKTQVGAALGVAISGVAISGLLLGAIQEPRFLQVVVPPRCQVNVTIRRGLREQGVDRVGKAVELPVNDRRLVHCVNDSLPHRQLVSGRPRRVEDDDAVLDRLGQEHLEAVFMLCAERYNVSRVQDATADGEVQRASNEGGLHGLMALVAQEAQALHVA